MFLAVILDVFSRKAVGWELDRTLAARLPLAALEKAIAERKPPPGIMHHSDRGVQYASDAYVGLLRKHGMIPSMSRPANPYDNASCESFIKTLKREEIYGNEYRDLEHLRGNVKAFIDDYYNRVRLHSALGYKPPKEFEQVDTAAAAPQGATMSFFRHEELVRSDVGSKTEGKPAPQTIVSMSLQLAIPRRVGLHQSPLPLRQLQTIVAENGLIKQRKPLDGKCVNGILSQSRGSPHRRVPKLCPGGCRFGPSVAESGISNLQIRHEA